MEREPPVVPERVRYYSFDEFSSSISKQGRLSEHWICVAADEDEVALYNDALQLRLEINKQFHVSITVRQLCQ